MQPQETIFNDRTKQACLLIRETFAEVDAWIPEQIENLKLIERYHRLLNREAILDDEFGRDTVVIHFAVDFYDLFTFCFPWLPRPPDWLVKNWKVINKDKSDYIDELMSWVLSNYTARVVLFYGLPPRYYPILMLPPHRKEYQDAEKAVKYLAFRAEEETKFLAQMLNTDDSKAPDKEMPLGRQKLNKLQDIDIVNLLMKFPSLMQLLSGDTLWGFNKYYNLLKTQVSFTPDSYYSQRDWDQLKRLKKYDSNWKEAAISARQRLRNNDPTDENDLLALTLIKIMNDRLDAVNPMENQKQQERHVMLFVTGSERIYNIAKQEFEANAGTENSLSRIDKVRVGIASLENEDKLDEPEPMSFICPTSLFRTYAFILRDYSDADFFPDHPTVITESKGLRLNMETINRNVSSIRMISETVVSSNCGTLLSPCNKAKICNTEFVTKMLEILIELREKREFMRGGANFLAVMKLFEHLFPQENFIKFSDLNRIRDFVNFLRNPTQQHLEEIKTFVNEQKIFLTFQSFAISASGKGGTLEKYKEIQAWYFKFGRLPFYVKFNSANHALIEDLNNLSACCDKPLGHIDECKAQELLVNFANKLSSGNYWDHDVNDEKQPLERIVLFLLLLNNDGKFKELIAMIDQLFPESNNLEEFDPQRDEYFISAYLLRIQAQIEISIQHLLKHKPKDSSSFERLSKLIQKAYELYTKYRDERFLHFGIYAAEMYYDLFGSWHEEYSREWVIEQCQVVINAIHKKMTPSMIGKDKFIEAVKNNQAWALQTSGILDDYSKAYSLLEEMEKVTGEFGRLEVADTFVSVNYNLYKNYSELSTMMRKPDTTDHLIRTYYDNALKYSKYIIDWSITEDKRHQNAVKIYQELNAIHLP